MTDLEAKRREYKLFCEKNPDYSHNTANGTMLVNYIRDKNLPITEPNLSLAFFTIKDRLASPARDDFNAKKAHFTGVYDAFSRSGKALSEGYLSSEANRNIIWEFCVKHSYTPTVADLVEHFAEIPGLHLGETSEQIKQRSDNAEANHRDELIDFLVECLKRRSPNPASTLSASENAQRRDVRRLAVARDLPRLKATETAELERLVAVEKENQRLLGLSRNQLLTQAEPKSGRDFLGEWKAIGEIPESTRPNHALETEFRKSTGTATATAVIEPEETKPPFTKESYLRLSTEKMRRAISKYGSEAINAILNPLTPKES